MGKRVNRAQKEDRIFIFNRETKNKLTVTVWLALAIDACIAQYVFVSRPVRLERLWLKSKGLGVT